MARAYTSRLAYLNRDAGTEVVVYVVPDDIRTVVRDIVLITGQPDQSVYVLVQVPGGLQYSLWIVPASTDFWHHLELRQALSPGDELRIASAGTGQYQIAITGYELGL